MLNKIFKKLKNIIMGKSNIYCFYDNWSFVKYLPVYGGGEESYSQFGQDRFILNMVFARKRDGIFLDIGGNHPIKMNNTYMFEKYGWTGYAFEPQKEVVELWQTARNTECFNVAVGDVDKMIEIGRITENDENGTLSGVVGTVKLNKFSSIYTVRQIVLTDFLDEKQIFHIDFVSIDVEGYEMNVLKGIDFNKFDITCLCIENNKQNGKFDNSIRTFMVKQGYVFVGRLTIDDIFIKKNVLL